MASNISESTNKPPTPPSPPWTTPNGIAATYPLNCHCGAIRLTMTLSPPLYPSQTEGKEQCVAVSCTCSHCARHGAISVHPLAKDVAFTQGLEERGEYLCGMKRNPHWFCKKCGCFVGTDLGWLMESVFGMENRCTINVSTWALLHCFFRVVVRCADY